MSEAPLTTVSRKLANETSRRIDAEVRAELAEKRVERLREWIVRERQRAVGRRDIPMIDRIDVILAVDDYVRGES